MSSPASTLPENARAVFAQRYRLERMLGRGGMGVVWLAYDLRLQRQVAVKFLPTEIEANPAAFADLHREVSEGLKLTHANIVRLHDLVEEAGTGRTAIVMEYVDGGSLSTLKHAQRQQHFEVAQLAAWVQQICSALSYLHDTAGLVHRDLKPGNLLVSSTGQIKISDFGVAGNISTAASQITGVVGGSGTVGYMSPEQAMGKAPHPSDDVYALGATLYDLLTARPPFFSGNFAAVTSQLLHSTPPRMAERRAELGLSGDPIPDTWEQVIAACLAKSAEERPSMAQVASRLSETQVPAAPPVLLVTSGPAVFRDDEATRLNGNPFLTQTRLVPPAPPVSEPRTEYYFPPSPSEPASTPSTKRSTLPFPAADQDTRFAAGVDELLRGDLTRAGADFRQAASRGVPGADEQARRIEAAREAAPQQAPTEHALPDEARAHLLYLLGRDFALGRQVRKDAAEAARLYQQAAELGSIDAVAAMAQLFMLGQGVPKLPLAAAALFRHAAQQGLGDAMLNLGILCEQGRGVPRSLGEAREWYERALAAGEFAAEERLERLTTAPPPPMAPPPMGAPPPPPPPSSPAPDAAEVIGAPAKFFVSYSTRDVDIVDPLVRQITARGYPVWMDRSGIDGAEHFPETLANAIDASCALIVMVSDHSVRSQWVQREVGYAVTQEKRLLPVHLEPLANAGGLRIYLPVVQGIKYYGENKTFAVDQITHTLSRLQKSRI